jgi:hypothetical protein
MKPQLVMIENDLPPHSGSDWQTTCANLFTALTGHLCVIVEAKGGAVAHITDIPVGVPPVVRRTAKLAAQI